MVTGWRSILAAPVLALVVVIVVPPVAQAQTPEPATEIQADVEATVPGAWLPHPLPAPAVPSVAFIGDSIGRDAQYYVRRQVARTHPIAYFHAVAAGYIGYHQYHSPLLSELQAPGGPDILLVELGTGDGFWDHSARRFERNLRRFLDAVLPHVSCVRWFDQKPTANIAYPHVNEHRTEFNQVLDRVLAEPQYRSENVAMVSYAAWYHRSGDRGFFLADRLHHTQAGRRELGLLAGQAAEGCDPTHTSGPFWDVPDRSGAAGAAAWLATAGVADPYRNGAFRARLGSFDIQTDRGQVADFLWRLAGEPTAPATTWHDIPTRLRQAAGWAQHEGVMRGYTDGSFRPTGVVTKAALATYLWRAAGRPTEGIPQHPWADVEPGSLAAVNWAVATGVLPPAGTSFGAQQVITRAQVAKALYTLALLFAEAMAAASADTTTSSVPAAPPTSAPTPTVTAAPATTVTTAPATTVVPPTTVPPPAPPTPSG